MKAVPPRPSLLDSAGARCAGYGSHDWSTSPVGHPATWPPELRSAVDLIVDARFPMFIAWGPELAMLYNAAYVPLLEERHPAALGAPLEQVWPEMLERVRPLVDAALAGDATFGEDVARTIVRHGHLHKCWFTVSYSAVRDSSGAPGGVLCVIDETTERVLLESRQALHLELVDRIRPLTDPDAILREASRILGHYLDVPHVFYGEVDDDAGSFRVAGDWAQPGAPSFAGMAGRIDDFGADVVAALRAGRQVVVEDVQRDARSAAHADAYGKLQVRSFLALPLLREGKLVASLNVYDRAPRHWNEGERGLAADVAERSWSAVERVRAEQALREASARQATLLSMNAFQLQLTDALRGLADPQAIFLKTSELLGRFLRANRVLYGNYDSEKNLVSYHSNYTDGSVAPLAGTYPTASFGDDNFASLRSGTWVAQDLSLDPRTCGPGTWPAFAAAQIRAAIVVPLNRHGAMIACLFVNTAAPRAWSEDEVRLVEDAAERAWSAVERVRAEEALRQADRRKDEFLAMLAHELRNPLAPISAAAQLLNMGPLDPARVSRTSGIIARQVAHMTGLIDDLLDVSRVTRGLVVLAREAVDLKRVVADAVEQVRPLIEGRRHRFAVHMAPGAALAEGDYKRLVQVLANLLNNAAKYTPEGGRLQVWMDTSADQVAIGVSDSGIGIAPELLPTIFELFSQAERTPDRSQGGLGLGLALVKSLVELHGGTVSVSSGGRDAGSEFTVRLPRLRREPAPAGTNAGANAGPALARGVTLAVLLVDDNVDAAQTLAMLLEAAGHRVTVAHDPRDALARAEGARFDACLLDIGLPGMDGRELARGLKAMPAAREAMMIAISGYGQQFDRDSALRGSFDHYFVKPVDPAELFALLARARPGTAH